MKLSKSFRIKLISAVAAALLSFPLIGGSVSKAVDESGGTLRMSGAARVMASGSYSFPVVGDKYLVAPGEKINVYDLSTGKVSDMPVRLWDRFLGLSGDSVYGLKSRNSGQIQDVYKYDLISRKELRIKQDASHEIWNSSSLSNHKIVWRDSRNDKELPWPAGEEHAPGSIYKMAGDGDLYLLDLVTGEEKPVVKAPGNQLAPALWNNKLYYYQHQSQLPGEGKVQPGLYEKDLVSGNIRMISEITESFIKYSSENSLKIVSDGTLLAFATGTVPGNPDYLVKNLITGEVRNLKFEPTDIENGIVVGWGDPGFCKPGFSSKQIYAYDFAKGVQAQLSSDIDFSVPPYLETPPSVAGKFILWVQHSDSGSFIYKAQVTDKLFTDAEQHWARKSIVDAVNNSWIKGYTDGKFRPDTPVTRAEFVTMMASVSNIPSVIKDTVTFKDTGKHWVTTGGLLEPAIWAELVVPSDYNGSFFRPDQYITRQEVAVMTVRGLSKNDQAEAQQGVALPFKDDANHPAWSKGFLNEAYEAGIIKGYPDGTFRGSRQVTRAEAVIMIQQMLRAKAEIQQEPLTVRSGFYNKQLQAEVEEISEKQNFPVEVFAAIRVNTSIEPDESKVTLSRGAGSITLYLNQNNVLVNDGYTVKEITLPASPYKGKLGHVMVPVEVLNIFSTSSWDEFNKVLTIQDRWPEKNYPSS